MTHIFVTSLTVVLVPKIMRTKYFQFEKYLPSKPCQSYFMSFFPASFYFEGNSLCVLYDLKSTKKRAVLSEINTSIVFFVNYLSSHACPLIISGLPYNTYLTNQVFNAEKNECASEGLPFLKVNK